MARLRSAEKGAAILAILLVVAVVGALVFAALNALASYRSRQVRIGWDETLGGRDEILQRHPRVGANAAALEVERMAAALGIALAPRRLQLREAPDAPRVPAAALRAHAVFKREHPYLFRQLENPRRGELEPPPAPVASYLRERRSELEALRRQLLDGEPPVWDSDLAALKQAPIPNLLGHIDLQKLLLTDAMVRIHAGDRTGALENLEAAWRLARALRDSPYLVCQLILIADTRMQLGTLRHIAGAPESWIERLAEHDFRAAFLTAMEHEGWAWNELDGADPEDVFGNQLERAPGKLRAWLAALTAPYARLCLADASDAYRRRVINLARVEALCDYDLGAFEADLHQIQLPFWNSLGAELIPSVAGAVSRLARLELDLELTRKLLEAEAVQRANGGSWPARVSGIEKSVACPADRWSYEPTNAGGIEIAFSRPIAWPDQRGAILATRVSVP